MRFIFTDLTEGTGPYSLEGTGHYVLFVGDVKGLIETNQLISKHSRFMHTTNYRSYIGGNCFEVSKVRRFKQSPTITGIASIYDYQQVPWEYLC